MTTRRVVTGIDSAGKSFAIHDGPTTGTMDMGLLVSDDVWVDDPLNADTHADQDPVVGVNRLLPPAGGSLVRLLTLHPPTRPDMPDGDAIAAGASRFDPGDLFAQDPDGDQGWHTTATIDYAIVLSGRVELGLDSGWIELGPGDVVVQRASRHAWRLLGDEPAQLAAVMVASPNYG